MVWYVVIGVASIALILFFMLLKRKQDALEESFQKRFAEKDIKLLDKYALFVAQESDGYSHFRGIGYLVLTSEELYFERQLKKKVVQIPVSCITHVGETTRLGGQSPGKTMLKITFKDLNGKQDSIALCVKELGQWKKEIAGTMGGIE